MPAPKPRIVPRVPLPPGEKLFNTTEVEAFLIAFGDDDRPLPETIKVLDEIVTDYIIETCHEAASVAHHARRAKIKLDDFKFMLRRDTAKLGRVSEMLETDKELKRKRKAFDTDEGAVLAKRDDETGDRKENELEKVEKGKGAEIDGERKKRKKKKDKVRGDDASTVRSG